MKERKQIHAYTLQVARGWKHGLQKEAYSLEKANRTRSPTAYSGGGVFGRKNSSTPAAFFKDMEGFLERHGRVIGKGAYGTVYVVKVTDAHLGSSSPLITIQTMPKYKRVVGGYEAWLGGLARRGGSVVIKVDKQSTLKEADKETAWHMEAFLCGGGVHIPKFGAAAFLEEVEEVKRSRRNGGISQRSITTAAITIMEALDGAVTLSNYIVAKQGISRQVLKGVEKAVTDLWLCGMYHGDLHANNVIVQEDGGHVQIIDFGFTIRLPASKMGALKAAVLRERGRAQPNYSDAINSVPLLREAIAIRMARRYLRESEANVKNTNIKVLEDINGFFNPDENLLKLIQTIYAQTTLNSSSPRRRTTPSPSPRRRTTPSPSPRRRTTPSPSPRRRTTPSPSPRRRTTPSPSPRRRTTPSPRHRTTPSLKRYTARRGDHGASRRRG